MGCIKFSHDTVAEVEKHSQPVVWNTDFVVHRDSFVAYPDGTTIWGHVPEGHAPRLQGLLAPFVCGQHAVPIGGM
jgi:hypothetical protein